MIGPTCKGIRMQFSEEQAIPILFTNPQVNDLKCKRMPAKIIYNQAGCMNPLAEFLVCSLSARGLIPPEKSVAFQVKKAFSTSGIVIA